VPKSSALRPKPPGWRQVAHREGTMTMIEDGVAEFLAGPTAIREVFA